MSRTIIKTQFHSNHSSTAYSPQSPSPPAPPALFSHSLFFSTLFFSPHAETKPVTHCVGCKWDVFWRDFKNVRPKAKWKTRIPIYTTKIGGEWERVNGSQRKNEKIHMSPHLHPASMSVSYIILLHNKSENPTSQLNESSSKPRYYQQGYGCGCQDWSAKSKDSGDPVETGSWWIN